jgi:serine protease inhibitor
MRRLPTLPVLVALMALSAAPLAVALRSGPVAAAATETDPSRSVAQSQAKLAWKLLAHGEPRDDAMVSPASLASAFWVLNLGADAQMQAALFQALELGDRITPDLAAALLERARKTSSEAGAGVFVSADQLVIPPHPSPSALLKAGLEKLGVSYRVADTSKVEDVKAIDAWVAEKTRGEIPQVLGKPLQSASFVALNALYFKDKWQEPFDPKATASAPFQAVDGSKEPVMLMRLTEAKRAYRADQSFIGVDLPFAGERFSLTVVTSNDGKPRKLADFEPAKAWLSGEGFAPRKGDLALPRFSLESESDLLPALSKDLAEAAKTPTALFEFGPDAKIEGILQRTKIEVDEEGATAAAATAVVVARSMVVDDALHMVVDKPYLFALRDRQSGLILAAGYVGKAPKRAH